MSPIHRKGKRSGLEIGKIEEQSINSKFSIFGDRLRDTQYQLKSQCVRKKNPMNNFAEMEQFYVQDIHDLEPLQRMVQYFGMALMAGKKEPIHILDDYNFSRAVFPEIFNIADVISLHQVEPGYMSADGSLELHQLIKEIEYARLCRNDPQNATLYHRLVQKAGVGGGNGCSNVLNGVLHSILKLPKAIFPRINPTPEIIMPLPNYAVNMAQLSLLKPLALAKCVHTKRENDFLPTFADIKAKVTENTVAIILTYPTNPSQATYEGGRLADLTAMISFCQEEGIFLIADNIYQDLVFPIGRRFEEIFNWTTSLDYLIKIYGSSKDTPFYQAYRTGYWFGDPRIADRYKYYVSSTETSLGFYNLLLFAVNLYFKLLLISGSKPTLEQMHFFTHGVFGLTQTVNPELIYKNIIDLDLENKYQKRLAISTHIQESAIQKVKEFLKSSDCFVDYINQNIGNVLFIRVNPKYFKGNDHEFFEFVLDKAKCSISPGNAFGMPLKDGEVWFRITLIHETAEDIIQGLQKIESSLRHYSS